MIVNNITFDYNYIGWIDYKREVERTNGIKTKEIIHFWLRLFDKADASELDEPTHELNLSYRAIFAAIRSKDSEKADFLYHFLSQKTIESRYNRLAISVKKEGIGQGRYVLKNNGDVIKENKVIINLKQAFEQDLVEYKNVEWLGKTSTYNPHELIIYLDGRPSFKFMGLSLSRRITFGTASNQDVLDIMFLNLIRNGYLC